jgi:hypothetical protein
VSTAAAAGVALGITWLVYTLSPARRAKANCCGNHASCITFRADVVCDSLFAVLFGVGMIASALHRDGDFQRVFTCAILMASFIATAVLSSKLGRAAIEQQASAVKGIAAPPAAASLNVAAPPKTVEVV